VRLLPPLGVTWLETEDPRLDALAVLKERYSLPTENVDGPHEWVEDKGWTASENWAPREVPVTVYLDREELATLMCTPDRLSFLVAGFLRSEGIIRTLDDIGMMRVCDQEQTVDVRLVSPHKEKPGKRILTSGCGGGVTFDGGSSPRPVTSDLRLQPRQLLNCMRQLLVCHDGTGKRRGTHTSALADANGLLVVCEDVGRHNTLDKIWGECMFAGIQTEGKILISTGRLSSEMMLKAGKMNVPVAVSLNSATERAVQLAKEMGITAVGYARGSRLLVYSRADRLGMQPIRSRAANGADTYAVAVC
jgi:FdhD protein